MEDVGRAFLAGAQTMLLCNDLSPQCCLFDRCQFEFRTSEMFDKETLKLS